MMKVSDLSENKVSSAVKSLIAFYNFTFFKERDVEPEVAFSFAIEQLACFLDLVDENDSSEMLKDFVKKLDDYAMKNKVDDWLLIREELPYL